VPDTVDAVQQGFGLRLVLYANACPAVGENPVQNGTVFKPETVREGLSVTVPFAEPDTSPPALHAIDWFPEINPGPLVNELRLVGNVAKDPSPRRYCDVVPVAIGG
jgi:hypothetical protein